MKRGLSRIESAILLASLLIIARIGASTHRWMWEETELAHYRATMQELTRTVRAMHSHALAGRRTIQLHIDTSRGVFQLISVQDKPAPYEIIERTIWLPEGLQVREAPEALTALPTGRMSPTAIIIDAPSHNRLFRLTTTEAGLVQLNEESTL